LYQRLYTEEFGQAGGNPFGALVGDYYFSKHPEDIQLLRNISDVAAESFCPFLTAPAPDLLGLKSWRDINRALDIGLALDGKEFVKWKSFRDTPNSRYVTMSLPRTLARLPWGKGAKKAEGFNFEEVELDEEGQAKTVEHEHYCWSNAAYSLAARLTTAFDETGWCTRIRGFEGGGLVENLPMHEYVDDDGIKRLKCPTEVLIPHGRDRELADQGFMPLCNYKRTDYAAFFSGQSTQKPKKYEGKEGPAATANAAICTRLPYIMAVSRVTHYLRIMAQDKIGSFMEVKNCQDWLNSWLKNYVLLDETAGPTLRPSSRSRRPRWM